MNRENIFKLASFGLLVLVMGLATTHTLISIYQDIGRHLTLGEMIWRTHEIPRTNLFSYTYPDYPFINHHWLSEVLLYLGEQVLGLSGLTVLKALMIAGAFGLALGAAWRPRVAVSALVVGVVALLIMTERTDVRPEVLSFVFIGWYLFVLYRRPRWLWTLPLVQLLWVNSHIYFFMGPFVWVAYLVGRWRLPSRRQWVITGLIALATLANPWFLSGALYPLRIMHGYGYSIVENKSPFFLAGYHYHQLTSVALYIGIVLTGLSFFVNRRQIRQNIFGLILSITTAVLALVMVRNFPLFALIMMPVVLTNLDQAGWYWYRRGALMAGMVGIGLLGASVVADQFWPENTGKHFGTHAYASPQQPIDFFRQHHLSGPIFNNFDIGSYLIWKLPEEKVFIDGRPEAYPAEFTQGVYIPMQQDVQEWKRWSEYYHIKTIFWAYTDITPWSQVFVARITRDPAWQLVYADQGVMILVRK